MQFMSAGVSAMMIICMHHEAACCAAKNNMILEYVKVVGTS